jgi:cell shape-determining protein MreD
MSESESESTQSGALGGCVMPYLMLVVILYWSCAGQGAIIVSIVTGYLSGMA